MPNPNPNQTKPKNRIEIKKINDYTVSVRIRKHIRRYKDYIVHEVEVVERMEFEEIQEFVKNLTMGIEVYEAERKYQLGPFKDVVIIETDGYMDIYGDKIVDYIVVYMALTLTWTKHKAIKRLAMYYLPEDDLLESIIYMALLSLSATDFRFVADLLLESIGNMNYLMEQLKKEKEKADRCGNQ